MLSRASAQYVGNPELPDLIYYNMQIYNAGTVPMNAKFSDTRSQAICSDPSQYELSIINFSAPGNSIPIFNVDSSVLEQDVEIEGTISTGYDGITGMDYMAKYDGWSVSGTGIPADSTITQSTSSTFMTMNNNATSSGTFTLTLTPPDNALIYTVTISANGIDASANVIFVPYNSYNPNGVYNYQLFLDMINGAFSRAFNILTAYTYVFPNQPPRLYYDPDTLLLNLYVPDNYIETGINVYMNVPLFQFMSSFKNEFFGYNTYNGKDYQILIDRSATIIPTGGTGTGPFPPQNFLLPYEIYANPPGGTGIFNTYVYVTQEYQTLNDWNDLESIIFTSNSMKTQPEFIPSIGQNGAQANFNDNSQPILTSFIPLIEGAGLQRSQFVYNPTGEYRMISMTSSQKLINTDLQVYWVDSSGVINPLILEPQFGLSVKFLFRKKSVVQVKY